MKKKQNTKERGMIATYTVMAVTVLFGAGMLVITDMRKTEKSISPENLSIETQTEPTITAHISKATTTTAVGY